MESKYLTLIPIPVFFFPRPKEVMGYTPEDVLMGVLPFFHIYGKTVILLTALSLGAKIVTLPRFEDKAFLKTIQDYKVCALHNDLL